MMKKRKFKSIINLIIISLLTWLFINILTTCFYYKNYNSNIDIIAQMLSITTENNISNNYEPQNSINKAVEILKGHNLESIKNGKEILKQYGYLKNNQNALYKQLQQNCIISALVSFLLLGILSFFLALWQKSVFQKKNNILLEIEQTLINFRENNLSILLNDDESNELGKIKYQLDAIGNHLNLLKEEAKLERDGTKELVSDISHQLKTPVAALDTCFSILLHENLSKEEQMEFSIRCRNALDGLETLLQSLLQISKMEVGLIQIEKNKLPILDTIITAINRVYPKTLEKNIELIFNCDDSLEYYKIMQDKKWLSEAIINVLDNAIKYSPDNSEIFVYLQKRNGFIRIEIKDNGIGIPKEEYHKIFQRFFRGKMNAVSNENGSGIGLFLTRKIIENHNGTITVSSNLGNNKNTNNNCGSTFVIQLPESE